MFILTYERNNSVTPHAAEASPTIGDDNSSRWWLWTLFPGLVVAVVFGLAVFLGESRDTEAYLGGMLSMVLLLLIVLSSVLSIAGLYIDVDKLRARNLDWSPRAWLYIITGMILSGLFIWWQYDESSATGLVLLSVNLGMWPVGLVYVVNRLRYAGST